MPVLIQATDTLEARIKALPEEDQQPIWDFLDTLNTRVELKVADRESFKIRTVNIARLLRTGLDVIARVYEIRPEHIIIDGRVRRHVLARQAFIALMYSVEGIGMPRLATLLRRDRSTVSHAYKQHCERIALLESGAKYVEHGIKDDYDYMALYRGAVEMYELNPPILLRQDRGEKI